MKLHVLSDLHLAYAPYEPQTPLCDVVVLAGDIDAGARGVRWAQKHFSSPVVYILGNHDYQGGGLDSRLAEVREAARGSNVFVLENETRYFDTVRFIGASLWTDLLLTGNRDLARQQVLQSQPDYRRMAGPGGQPLTTEHLEAAHWESRRFLARELSKPFFGKTVVVTHHAPSARSLDPRFCDASSHLACGYASDLGALLSPQVNLWVHGHVHHSFDYLARGSRVLCNPRGNALKRGNSQFDEALVVEV